MTGAFFVAGLPPTHAEFLKYYRRLMHDAGGEVPTRVSVRPVDIKPMLPWIAIAEREGPHHLVPTIIGSGVDDALQASFTGINLFDHWNEQQGIHMERFYSSIADLPCGGYNIRTLEGQNGLKRGYHASIFPLVGSSGQIDKLIGIISVSQPEPLLPEFGTPDDIETVDIAHIEYIDIGFGIPS